MRLTATALALLCLCAPAQAQVFPNPASGSWKATTVHALGPKPRLSCGWTMRAYFGGRYGPAFNRVRHWLTLPRTAPAPGAVVVWARRGKALGGGPGGHVARIVALRGKCRALVQDNRGTYERGICNALGIVRA